jgi:hypothetical protein
LPSPNPANETSPAMFFANGNARGVTFTASGVAPPGNPGSYQWVQLLNSDQVGILLGSGSQSCTSFVSTATDPELDGTYRDMALVQFQQV